MKKHFVDYLFESISLNHSKELVVGRFGSMLYGDLVRKVSSYSSFFSSNLGKGEICLLQSRNSPFFIKAYLSIMYSGNIVVPIDQGYNRRSIVALFDKIKPKMVVCDNNCNDNYRDIHVPVINEDSLENFPSENIQGSVYNKIAQLLPTTGTTASPKFVTLTHRNLTSNCKSIIDYLRIEKNDTIALVLPLSYTFGLSILHTFLRQGAKILFCNDYIFFNKLFSDIQNYNCTFFAGVPSHYRLLLKKSNIREQKLTSLGTFLQAGGALDNESIVAFTDVFPKSYFYVMYGQTEATARLTYLDPDLLVEKLGSVGKPISGVKIEIINESGKSVKVGEVGEIVVSGENVMSGYYNNPDETSLVLKDGRLSTGDLARYDNDGFVFIEGRKKNFIKSGGVRINGKEIEEIILSYSGVIDCRVFGIKDDLLGEAIEAVVLMDSERDYSKASIIRHCKKRLSSYKVPRHVRFVEEEQLKSGKIISNT